MPSFGMNIELDIDLPSPDAAAVAYDWFDEVSRDALGDARAAVENGGPAPAAPPYVDPASWNPGGDPVEVWGGVDITGWRSRRCSATVWPWLRQQLADEAERVAVSFWLTAGPEPDSPAIWYPTLYAHRPEESPGWVRIGAFVAESTFVGERYGHAAQRQWLTTLRSFAERCNPGFGQIEYGYDTEGSTGLEHSFPPHFELADREPEYTVGQSRKYLRGYSWLTVVPAELADRLGGAEAMRRSGAFVEATDLKAGGLWLLATEDYRDYGPERVERVFRALAPVLRPGKPISKSYITGKPPQRIVLEDAAG